MPPSRPHLTHRHPAPPYFFRQSGTGAAYCRCGAVGSASFCRSVATMPNPLRPPEPEPASPSQVASLGTFSVRGPVGIEVAAIVVAALYLAREGLIPVTLAMLLSFVLSPLVELLRQIWLGRILSVVLAVVLALGLILAL